MQQPRWLERWISAWAIVMPRLEYELPQEAIRALNVAFRSPALPDAAAFFKSHSFTGLNAAERVGMLVMILNSSWSQLVAVAQLTEVFKRHFRIVCTVNDRAVTVQALCSEVCTGYSVGLAHCQMTHYSYRWERSGRTVCRRGGTVASGGKVAPNSSDSSRLVCGTELRPHLS